MNYFHFGEEQAEMMLQMLTIALHILLLLWIIFKYVTIPISIAIIVEWLLRVAVRADAAPGE